MVTADKQQEELTSKIVQSFMSLFSPPPRRRKSASTNANSTETDSSAPGDPEDSTEGLDLDKLEHYSSVIEGFAAEARGIMALKGVLVTESALTSARKIMYKVSMCASVQYMRQ